MTRGEATHEALREAFSASVEAADDGRHCPSWEAIWQSAHGELEPRDEDGVILHIGDCAACAAAWRMARNLAADSPGRKPQTRVRPGRVWWWFPVAAAAAVALAVIGVSVIDGTSRKETGPVYRAREGDWLQSRIGQDDVLNRENCLLHWTPGPEGTTYHVRVTSEKLDVIAEGRRLETADFLVPPEALTGLPAGSKIVWQVTARLPDGSVVDSPSFISQIE